MAASWVRLIVCLAVFQLVVYSVGVAPMISASARNAR